MSLFLEFCSARFYETGEDEFKILTHYIDNYDRQLNAGWGHQPGKGQKPETAIFAAREESTAVCEKLFVQFKARYKSRKIRKAWVHYSDLIIVIGNEQFIFTEAQYKLFN